MLQIDRLQSVAEHSAPASDVASPAELYAAYAAFLRRQFPAITLVISVVLALAAVYLLTTPARYTGKAELVIDSHKLNLFQQQNPMGVDAPVDTSIVDSQVEILKSEKIALAVIKELHLVNEPEFVGPRGGLIGAALDLISRAYNALFGSNGPPTEFALTQKAVQRFDSQLTVKRVALTYVIDIEFQSVDADRAARIANAVADAYILDSLEAKYQSTKRAASWLQDRLKELRAEATAADRAEVEFKAQNNIVDTGGRLLNEQQLAELNSALVMARAQTAEAQAKLTRVQQILDAESRNPAFDDQTATVTDTLHDDVITRLRQQYLDIAARESDWSARYGRNHQAVVALRNQMQEIRKSIDDELRRIAQTYKSDYDIAKSREDSVQKALDDIVAHSNDTNQAQITLRELDSTAQSYRAIADNFLQQYMMSVQRQSFPITEARLIRVATPPTQPSHPRTLLVLAIAAVGGIFLSIGVGMLRDFSDRAFRSGSQVEANLAANCIAIMPRVKADEAWQTGSLTPTEKRDPRSRTIGRGSGMLWHTANAPFSRFTEGIRSIKVAADTFESSKSNKVVAVTSALPNEGKSTIAMALALLIAEGGSRVVLVDGDLRNPSLSRKLAPRANAGLLEVISNAVKLEDAIWTDALSKLRFLPAVVRRQSAHTTEWLGSEAMKSLFERLRGAFDYVIVDLSPLAPVVDVKATVHLFDSYLFVVEWGETKIDVVTHALGTARGIYDNLLGIVLNKANTRVLNRYENHRCDYYYDCYWRYGYRD
jgi:polysaccharide biosynthesis transport protein